KRQGRKRLAWLVRLRRADEIHPRRRSAQRWQTHRDMAPAHHGPEGRAGRQWLGWRLVPPRLLGRRHAARLRCQCRMPHRFHCPILERIVGRRRTRTRRARDAGSGQISGAWRRSVDLLFTPPFVDTQHDPGYIKGYPAGLRENGGQYTHGVLWTVAAFAELGMGNRAGELFSMLNPINHSRSRTAAQRYRVEPYVACGDVYSMPPHVGRGGWTWYSGSAGWMYRVGIEWILGLHVKAGKLVLDPCIPSHWPRFEATLRYKGATFKIMVENPIGVCKGIAELTLDDVPVEGTAIVLPQDGGTHQIRAVMGEARMAEQQPQANAAQ